MAAMMHPAAPREAQLAAAIRLHQQGQLDAAEAAYAALLKRQPRHFDGLHLSGVAALQNGRLEEGITRIRRAIAINPRAAAAHSNLGSGLLRLGRFAEALTSLDRALKLDPHHAEAQNNLGYALTKLQRFDEAVAAYDRALALRPEYAEAHSNRGHALADRHDLQESLAAHETALRLRPNSAEFHSNVALALFALDRHVEALAAYDQALALHPGQTAALIGRAEVLLALGRMPEALANADEAITADPHVLNGHLWRARVLILLGMPDAALEATAVARQIAPQDPEAHISHGFALAACNRIEAALLSYDEALQLQPNHIEAQWHRALALLVLGRFQEGWLAYESRNLRRKTMAARKYPQPLWWGQQSLKDQRLYLYWEQGLGDTLHFARYALLAKAAGAQVFLSVQAPLRRVVQGLDPAITILDQNEVPPDFDLHAPLMSLPMAFVTRLETIPALANGYLSASAEDVARWLPQLPQGRRRIGLVWSGSATHRNDANRSIPLARLMRLIDNGDAWVSLQKEVRVSDQGVLQESGMFHPGAALGDFADTAGLIAALDLVISVDTSVAHLAAAMGKPVWLMLPFAPDFRWLLDRQDSPWYPGIRLFRQKSPGDWDGVIDAINAALRT